MINHFSFKAAGGCKSIFLNFIVNAMASIADCLLKQLLILFAFGTRMNIGSTGAFFKLTDLVRCLLFQLLRRSGFHGSVALSLLPCNAPSLCSSLLRRVVNACCRWVLEETSWQCLMIQSRLQLLASSLVGYWMVLGCLTLCNRKRCKLFFYQHCLCCIKYN